jgi:hypothetical protein
MIMRQRGKSSLRQVKTWNVTGRYRNFARRPTICASHPGYHDVGELKPLR